MIPLRVDQVLFNSMGTDVVIEDLPYLEKSLPSISQEPSIEREMVTYTEEMIDLGFETVKEYHNFFRSNNLTSVLAKYERRNP